MAICPKCTHEHVVKAGKVDGLARRPLRSITGEHGSPAEELIEHLLTLRAAAASPEGVVCRQPPVPLHNLHYLRHRQRVPESSR